MSTGSDKCVPRLRCRYLESSLRGDKPRSRNVEFLSAHRAQRDMARDSGDRGHQLRDIGWGSTADYMMYENVHCYGEHYKIIATVIDASTFTDFDLKSKTFDFKKIN